MITGFNHNIKYKNQIYHIQTEDSGTKNPHIITHLFVGGNIIATRKSDYAQLMAQTAPDKLPDVVRNSMEEQHKAMLRSLIHGKFDNALNAAGAHHLSGPAPLNVDADVLARTGGSGNKGSSLQSPAPLTPPPRAPPPPHAPAPVLLTTPKPPVPRPPVVAPPPDLAAAALAALAAGRTNTPRSSPAPVPMPPDVAPEVLAAMQLKEKPQEKPVTGDTIFGEDLISEKSLDEVILSYLSEELE